MSRPEEQLTPDQWAELKNILLAEERKRIDQLEDNWTFPDGFSQQVANVLPLAVDKSEKKDEELTETLYPVVEKSIYRSVKVNIQPMADALFPVMGPAIRKAIQDAMRKTVESLNQTLESSFTAQGIKWRLQAKATGRSYAEVVLKNTLLFRVEQVFLIHRSTGLLIAHESINPLQDENSDMISGMLTAIQDFVRDSFQKDDSQNLESIQVGSSSVWIEQSPNVILAAVVEGEPPLSLRDLMKETLEEISHRFGRMLNDFDGDTTPYKPAHRIIGQCLISEAKENTKKKGVSPALIPLLVLVLALGALFTLRGIQQHKWNQVVKQIKAEPGMVILNEGRHGRVFRAEILRDKRAIYADEFIIPGKWNARAIASIKDTSIGGNRGSDIIRLMRKRFPNIRKNPNPTERHSPVFHFIYRPFVSSDPYIILRQLDAYGKPESVVFTDSLIIVSGTAPASWIGMANRSGLLGQSYIPIDISRLKPSGLDSLRRVVEAIRFQFGFAKTELNPEDLPRVETLKSEILKLDEMSQLLGTKWTLEVTGTADAVGSPEQNLAYATTRARLFFSRYLPAGLSNVIYKENAWKPDSNGQNNLTPDKVRSVSFKLIEKNQPE